MYAQLWQWLMQWLTPVPPPMPGQTWRFHTGEVATIQKTQPTDHHTAGDHPMFVNVTSAHVIYKMQDGTVHRADYELFLRSGQAIPPNE